MLEQLTDSSQAALTLLHYLKRAERGQTPGTETPNVPRNANQPVVAADIQIVFSN